MTYQSEVLRDVPIAFWRLGETTGAVAADSSGFGRGASYAGPILSQPGALASDSDGAILCDGVDDRLDLPALPPLGDSLTIELWFRPQSGGDAVQCLLGEADGSPSLLFKTATQQLSLFYAAADHLNASPLALDAWHHVCVAVSAGAVSFFVDGAADGAAASFPSGFAPDRIGDDNAGNTFKGWLDEVALYATALASDRVAAHYAAAFRGSIALLPRLRRLLKDEDPSALRWSDAELVAALARAVDDFSRVSPDQRLSALTTTAGSRELSIATLDQLVCVEAVEWPAGEFPPLYVPFQTWGSTLTLLTTALPDDGEEVNVFWGRRHQLEARNTTLPVEAEETVLAGAAGYAAEAWSSFASNRANVAGAEASRQYEALAGRWLARFREEMRTFGRAARVRPSTLYAPARPWAGRSSDAGP